MTTTATTPPDQTFAPGPAGRPRGRWTPGRLVVLGTGVLFLLGSAAMCAGAIGLDRVDDEWRDGDYLTTDAVNLETNAHALVVDEIDLDGLDADWFLGDARVRVTAGDEPVFVGIARETDATAYLRGVDRSVVTDISDSDPTYALHTGDAPAVLPTEADIWIAQATGTGTQTLEWTPKDGSWMVVIMNADGSAELDVTADVGATVPLLEHSVDVLQVGSGLAGLAGLGLAGGAVLRQRRVARENRS